MAKKNINLDVDGKKGLTNFTKGLLANRGKRQVSIVVGGQEDIPLDIVLTPTGGALKAIVMDEHGRNVHSDRFSIFLRSDDAVALNEDFVLIDLSNPTGVFSHPTDSTGIIHIHNVKVTIDPTSSFRGEVEFGYLSRVDATNGDFEEVFDYPFISNIGRITESLLFAPRELVLTNDHHAGEQDANETDFQTDVVLNSINGTTVAPGKGDLIVRVIRTAGSLSFSALVLYDVESES